MESFQEKQKNTAKRLEFDTEKFPAHIAIIMDGNGRWAKQQGKQRYEGHRQGGKTVEKIALHCVALGVKSLTLYAFSSENWNRSKLEISALMFLFSRYLAGIRAMLKRNDVKLIHLGRRERLPKKVLKELDKTIELTANNKGMTLALALNYGGHDEIVDAAKALAKKYAEGDIALADIDSQSFSQHLYAPQLPTPDLLIRTANEMRISNFLLWQLAYTEFYVTDITWPDFNEACMDKAIKTFANRSRRFGNVETQ